MDVPWVAPTDESMAGYSAPHSVVNWVASMVATTAVTMVGNWDDVTDEMWVGRKAASMAGRLVARMGETTVVTMVTHWVCRKAALTDAMWVGCMC